MTTEHEPPPPTPTRQGFLLNSNDAVTIVRMILDLRAVMTDIAKLLPHEQQGPVLEKLKGDMPRLKEYVKSISDRLGSEIP